jgi:hypothetical protein
MMNRRSMLVGAISMSAVALFFSSPAGAQADGWTTLFDGKNLDSWNKTGDANWRIEDGLVVADRGSGHLVTKTSYGDFAIRAEFWVDSKANSGIFIRQEDAAKPSSKTGY